MSSILEQLFNGEILPHEQCNPKSETYQALKQRALVQYNSLVATLSDTQKQQFIHILDEQFDLLPLEDAENFSAGFRLGAKLMLEVLRP